MSLFATNHTPYPGPMVAVVINSLSSCTVLTCGSKVNDGDEFVLLSNNSCNVIIENVNR